MENGLSASDIALMSGNRNDFGGDAFMWIFALLILAGGGGFGGWGNDGYRPQYATQEFVQSGFNFNDLQDQNRDLMQAITAGTAQSVATTNGTYHDTVNALNDKYGELARDIAGVAVTQREAIANQNDCCCSTKMLISEQAAGINAGIAQNRYDAAMNVAAINATTTAQTQKILDALAQNKIEALQSKVNALELQNATANVLRYPNSWTYNAGTSPFCSSGCGCGVGV